MTATSLPDAAATPSDARRNTKILVTYTSAIFLSALYQYAAYEKVPQGFDRASIEGAFTPKSSR